MQEIRPQRTTSETCEKKKTYYSKDAGVRAAKRRNKTAGYKYLRSYQCDVCWLWHTTTQLKEKQNG